MASNDLDELSGLNNPCSSLCLALKCFFEPFQRKEEGRKEGQNGHVDLRARTSPQVKISPPPFDLELQFSQQMAWKITASDERKAIFMSDRHRHISGEL